MKTKRILSVVIFTYMLSAATAGAISLDLIYSVEADFPISTPLQFSFENNRVEKDFRLDMVNMPVPSRVVFPGDYTGDQLLYGNTVNWGLDDTQMMNFQGWLPHTADWEFDNTLAASHVRGIAGGGPNNHIAPIPEPSVLLLIAVGLVMLSSKKIRKLMNK